MARLLNGRLATTHHCKNGYFTVYWRDTKTKGLYHISGRKRSGDGPDFVRFARR